MSKLSNCLSGQCQPGYELKGLSKGLGGASRRTAEQNAGHQIDEGTKADKSD